jgi:Ti-type conjugative transfer relaxase TraA
MLSIGAMGNGQGTYYVGLAREDYYLEGGEPPGQWIGRGSEALGLRGEVAREEFLNLFAGVDAQGVKLVQNAGDPKRQPGWDLTFSAPKSVSTVWAIADSETRAAIQKALFVAAKSALKTIEEEATTRRGHWGTDKESAKLVIATFEHGTSRAQDPNLHLHALILNLGVRADGTTGTLESQNFYYSKMVVGALFRAEFAKQLQGLGFEIERDGSSFRIVGVPKSLEEEFSKRRAEIEAVLEATGKDSARAAAFAALDTRTVKEHAARDELFQGWGETGREYNFTQAEVQSLRKERHELTPTERQETLSQMLESSVEKVSSEQSHFGKRQLLRALAEDAQGRGIGADEIRAALALELATSKHLVSLREGQEPRYTTRDLWEVEKGLLQSAKAWSQNKNHQVEQSHFLKGMLQAELRATQEAREYDPEATPIFLNGEQRAALSYLTKGSGGIALVSGMAGTGKTFLLDAAREVWEEKGLKVIGAAIAGKAARGLEEGADIDSNTVARLLHSKSKIILDEKTVLVIDEAGMVGTRQMAALIEKTQRCGTKLVLTGEDRQIQPVDVGGPFRSLEKLVGSGKLSTIVRQSEEWAREAVVDFADGRAEKALRAYDEKGLLTIAADRGEAKAALVESWKEEGIKAPRENVIFAGTRAEVKDLNQLAQDARRSAGQLGFRSAAVEGTTFYEKDRIVFTRGSTTIGVENGTTGKVQEIDTLHRTFTIKLDNGKKVFVPYDAYQEMSLGYALTTHKGQGMTTKNAFVLCGGVMSDREISYVQASRAREKTEFFTDKIMVWNPETEKREEATIQELGRRMSQSRQKDLAHDIVKQNEPAPKHQQNQTLKQPLTPELRSERDPLSQQF